MIHGAHVIIYSRDAEADRAFFRDVLEYESGAARVAVEGVGCSTCDHKCAFD